MKRIMVYKIGGQFFVHPNPIKKFLILVSNLPDNVLIVISAAKGVTRILESLALITMNRFSINKTNLFKTLVDNFYWSFENIHIDLINTLYGNQNHKKIVIEKFYYNFNLLKKIINEYDSFDKYFYGRVIKFGEIISKMIFSEGFVLNGVDYVSIDSSDFILTNSSPANGHYEFRKVKKGFTDIVWNSESKIFLMEGFISSDRKGNPTTIGKGGSDYSASVATSEFCQDNRFQVESLTYWKDVDGVFDKDPKKFIGAKIISQLSYQEYLNISTAKTFVVRPDSIQNLLKYRPNIFVKSFLNFFNPGTKIY